MKDPSEMVSGFNFGGGSMTDNYEERKNHYEEKRESRIERLRVRSAKARTESESRGNSHNVRTLIGMAGEPVKIGHHSERRHRRLIEKADNDMRKSVEANAKANDLGRRADAAESNTAISSDNPDAVSLLKEKLAGMEKTHAHKKAVNKAIRKKDAEKGNAELRAMGLSDRMIEALRTPDFAGRVGYPSYEITNNNANMKRVRDRIAELERMADVGTRENLKGDGWEIEEDEIENRIFVFFDRKPPRETTKAMRSHGWRWKPSSGAWSRHLNGAGRSNANYLHKLLSEGKYEL